MVTRYNWLETEELLRMVRDNRHRSPVVDELCRHLEYYFDREGDSERSSEKIAELEKKARELEDKVRDLEEISPSMICPICDGIIE